ncbi:hypothetical protein AB9P05_15735 [Roseivirga sp. BDSF3-8]|uniref:hypothetical protein n=1 Tax=Roseivirga sp. BDSF3-8 TaxID=3241598 RepID=UPI0035318DFD
MKNLQSLTRESIEIKTPYFQLTATNQAAMEIAKGVVKLGFITGCVVLGYMFLDHISKPRTLQI